MEAKIEQTLHRGITAHKDGKFQEAERFYRTILRTHKTHPDANHNLGVLLVSANKAKEALPLFKTAIEARPKTEQFWLSYIHTLIKENQVEMAKLVLADGKEAGLSEERVNALQAEINQIPQTNTNSVSPSDKQLSTLLGYYRQGQYNEAEKLAISITQEFPEHQFSWKVLGAIFGQSGRISESLAACQNSVNLAPHDAEAHNNLGNTLRELGKLSDSEASLRQAITLKADFSGAHNNLGATLKELGRLEEAEESLRQAITLKANYAEAHNNLGATLQDLGRLEEAEESFRQAIRLNPDNAEAHNNLGATLQDLGRLEEAKSSFGEAIALKSELAEAHQNLASMKTFDERDKQFLKMQELYLDESCSEDERCRLNFALGKASEDLKDFEQAFNYYSKGNALRKKLLNYHISQDIALFQQLKASYPQIKKYSLESRNLSERLTPIFIVGLPRSGTTLVEQIISSHSQVTGAGELEFVEIFGGSIARGLSRLDTNTLLRFREDYLNKLKPLSNGSPFVTDKLPQNFLYLGLITAALPEAKILLVKRNPAAVCWSNYKQFFESKGIGYSYALSDVIEYYALYKDLMDFWNMQFTNRIFSLSYELLTTNQEDETKKLIKHLGLNWENSCLSPQNNKRSVATASNIQVRNQVYQGSSQKWKVFRPYLNGALDCLEICSEN